MHDYKRCFCALMLLGALAGCGRGVDPSVIDPYEVLRAKLGQIVTVDWDDVPLEAALRELGEQHGLFMAFDRAALEAERPAVGVRPALAERITLHARDIRLRSVLHLLLDDTYVRWLPRDREILITSKTVADTSLISRLYLVGDVTRQPESFDEEKLAEVVKQAIKSDGWEDAGGPGKLEVRPGALFIQQTSDVHEQIGDLLADLRSPLDGDDAPPPGARTAASTAIHKALDTRVTVDLNRAPGKILREMVAQQRINVVVKWRQLDEANVSEEAFNGNASQDGDTGDPVVLTDVPWRAALDLALEPLGLGWTVRDDALRITSREEADTMLWVRYYPPPPGIDTRRLWNGPIFSEHGVTSDLHPVSELDERLTQLVAPESWKVGGPASHVVPPRMLVAQTQRGHEEVANWLRQLRRAADPRVIDYDERATSPQAERLWRALEQPVTIDLDGSARVERGIKALLARLGVPNVLIDFRPAGPWTAKMLEEANARRDDWLPVLNVKNVSLAGALDSVLEPLGLGWYTRDNVLIVTSKEKVDTTMVNLAYRCPCLASGDTESMSDLVLSHVKPDSWKEAGGPGSQAFVFGNVLSVSQTWTVHRQLRHFLRQWHAAQDATAPATIAASPAEQKLSAALECSVTFAGKEQPLLAAVAEFAQHCGVENVVWQWNSIAQHEDDRFEEKLRMGELRAEITPTGQAAGDVLARVLAAHDLEWTIEHDALCVRYENDKWTAPIVTGFHRVPKAIMRAIGGDREMLLDIVRSHFQYDSWKDGGGPGTIDVASGKILVVSQSWPLQHHLQLFLRQWEASLDPSNGASPVFVLSPAERRVQEAMERRITFSCSDRPLAAAVTELAQRAGAKDVLWDWRRIAATVADDALGQSDRYENLRSGKLRATIQAADEAAGDVLTRLLQPYGLSWTLKHGALCVTRENLQPQLITAFYRVPKIAMAVIEAAAAVMQVEPRVPKPPHQENDPFGGGAMDAPPRWRSWQQYLGKWQPYLPAWLGALCEPPAPQQLPAPNLPPSTVAMDPFGEPPPPSPAEELLMATLIELLGPPDSWKENGGPGQISVVTLPRGQGLGLIITHTMSRHRQAQRLLERWEQTPKLPDEIMKLLKLPKNDSPPPRKLWRKRPVQAPIVTSPIPVVG